MGKEKAIITSHGSRLITKSKKALMPWWLNMYWRKIKT